MNVQHFLTMIATTIDEELTTSEVILTSDLMSYTQQPLYQMLSMHIGSYKILNMQLGDEEKMCLHLRLMITKDYIAFVFSNDLSSYIMATYSTKYAWFCIHTDRYIVFWSIKSRQNHFLVRDIHIWHFLCMIHLIVNDIVIAVRFLYLSWNLPTQSYTKITLTVTIYLWILFRLSL